MSAGDVILTPVMHHINAFVMRPAGYIEQPSDGACLAIGAGPFPEIAGAIYVAIRHVDGSVLIAVIPSQCIPAFEGEVKRAVRAVQRRRFEQGAIQGGVQ